MSLYIQYYDDQVGDGVRNVFSGSTYRRGRRVGAWLGGLFRKMLPYISSGVKAVGKETLRAGINVLDDVTNNGANFKEAVKLRAKESGKNLKRQAAIKIAEMMKGSGYKALARKRRQQSRKPSGLVRMAVKKKKRSKGRTTKNKKKKKGNSKKKKKPTYRDVNDIFGPK